MTTYRVPVEGMEQQGRFPGMVRCGIASRSSANIISERPQSLEDIVAFDALLRSGERYPAPKCHPDTRKVALDLVKSWIWNRGAGFKAIMWVSGTPGAGKSALLQTTCETLADTVHASFFFERGQGARELATSLAPTIAHQFTISSIICQWYIWYLLRSNPTILREAFDSQFRKLVIAPASARSYVQYPMVVVIDGLDECVDAQDRVALLELIFEAANTKSIRFLIASRPEREIENFFMRPDVAQHVDHIVLDEATFGTSKDIRIFLRSEFARIRQSRPDLIFDLIEGEEWPGDAIIDRATVDSDGQFIFPTLFIGYLDDDLFSPQEQLATLLNPPAHVAAFSKLDRLYHQILTRRPRNAHQSDVIFLQYQDIVKGILHVIIAWPVQLPIAGIARLLGLEVQVVENIVRGPLKTLFKFQGSGGDSKIAFCHKSLGDCLLDPRRSGKFHVPPNALDLLYHHILSRPPPPGYFSREDLIAVLHMVLAWPGSLTKGQIASALGLGHDTLGYVVDTFRDLIFRGANMDFVDIFHASFEDFSLDLHRSREFHVPPNALDLVCLRILSRPPPSDPAQTFTREQLFAVLHAVLAWPEYLAQGTIASVTGLDLDIVTRVVAQLKNLIFIVDEHTDSGELSFSARMGERVSFRARTTKVCIGRIHQDHCFRDFMVDPDRSGNFYVSPDVLSLLYSKTILSTLSGREA